MEVFMFFEKEHLEKYLTPAVILEAPQSDYRLLRSGFTAGRS
jgi:hypothetical protein